MKYIYLTLLLLLLACSDEPLFSEDARQDYWLLYEGAEMPIVVEGNTASKIFVILLHGGPGGSSQTFNYKSKPFSDELEENYAMVYYDQRSAGLSRGTWDPENLTIERHIKDLKKVIEFIETTYGSDINLFLAGHSWGGYLASRYLMISENQDNINAWINIDGLIHRNRNNKDRMDKIIQVGQELIATDNKAGEWISLIADVQAELDKDIIQYDVESQRPVNRLMTRAEDIISTSGILTYNFSSQTSAISNDNYDPLYVLLNDRNGNLNQETYDDDSFVRDNLSSITIPTLSIYGKYDVRTAPNQGIYLLDKIGSTDAIKEQVILETSDHSAMLNQPIELAEEMIQWIELYK